MQQHQRVNTIINITVLWHAISFIYTSNRYGITFTFIRSCAFAELMNETSVFLPVNLSELFLFKKKPPATAAAGNDVDEPKH